MSFLGELGNQIASQFSVGENSTHTLDAVIDGSNVKYGSLGDFAKNIDQSAQRSYVEEGYLRLDPYTTSPKQMEILMQEPNATVLLKKRMFASVGDNFRPDYMDADEKTYYQATKILFQNKCTRIAALEKLSKIQKITAAVGNVSDQLMPVIFTLTDQLNIGSTGVSGLFGSLPDSNPFSTGSVGQFVGVIDSVRKVYAFNQTNAYTTWIVDNLDAFQSTLGAGTGVIELTNFQNFTTNVTVDMASPGGFSVTIQDPYESMLITDYDIEVALSNATNMFYNHKSFQFGTQSAQNVIQTQQSQLNRARSARNASPLNIIVDPNTLLGNRVTVIIERTGTQLLFTYDAIGGIFAGLGGPGNGAVKVDPAYLINGVVAGYDGLDTGTNISLGPDNNIRPLVPQSELSLFQSVISAIYNQIQMTANSQGSLQNSNELTNYARRKMRFNFSGQLIVQPMDSIHFYINSKSLYDAKVLSGLQSMYSGLGILQNINNTVSNFDNNFNSIFNPSGDIPFQLEKSVYVGSEFPNYLWSLMRTQFVSENEGTHVFAGVVENATDNWADGKFVIDVRGKDNSIYFEQGKVNFKPGADTFNGSWFDPLTPFVSSYDQVSTDYNATTTPQLLNENLDLLSSSAALSSVKAHLGPMAGTKLTSSNYLQDRSVDPLTGKVTNTFYAPNGLVYKWKEGIGVFTQAGLSTQINDPNRVGSPNVFQEPFAGQDVMNVISLLITGIPYNFTNFYKAVLGNGNFGSDPQSNLNASFAFINSITSQISKNNTLWGNFIPFKSLSIGEKTYAQAQANQFSITQQNMILNNQLAQWSALNQQTTLYAALKSYAPNLATTDPNFVDLTTQINNLKTNINHTISNITNQNQSFYQQAGNDPTFNSSSLRNSTPGTNTVSDPQVRKDLRREINYLTRRMSYNIRANEDKNLFIVDDSYDKDYDILAYASSLTDGIKIWNNEFTSVKEKILQTANLLNLEVFCDTQGHVRVRPPQYNRMPSSVFYRMMYLKQALHVQIFPDYLNSLFEDQLQGLKTQLEIVEDEIRLDCAVGGIDNDTSAARFINTGAASNSGGSFAFLSDSASGEVTDVNSLIQQANPDVIQSQISNGIATFGAVQSQTNLNQVFTNIQRFTVINQAISGNQQSQNGFNTANSLNSVSSDTYVNLLIGRIQDKSGQKISLTDYIQTNTAGVNYVALPTNQTIDIFKVTSDLQSKISSRQRLLKSFYNTLKNTAEYISLDNDTSISSNLVTPGNFTNQNIPEVFENMIEDETYDDYGLNSGSRYIIKRARVKNITIAANPPEYTTVEVQGILSPTLANPANLPSAINFFPSSGNGMVTAFAVDYDLWRNFGFKGQATVQVPFLSDPITQCGPYAAMYLSRARKNIIRGSVTISGDEHMQPGEVVYLEDRGMLFYVTSVRHNFSFANSFTTTLELTYGHTPGEYIPTTVDFIGKLIYQNKDNANIIIRRQVNSGNEISVGALILGSNYDSSPIAATSAINTGGANETPTPINEFNSQIINNILFQATYMINANSSDTNNFIASVEIRVYNDDSNSVNSSVQALADQVKTMLTTTGGPKTVGSANSPNQNTPLDSKYVKVVTVNLDSKDDRRSPSQQAWDAARNQLNSSSSPFGGNSATSQTRQALFSYIVDCWVIRTANPSTPTPNGF